MSFIKSENWNNALDIKICKIVTPERAGFDNRTTWYRLRIPASAPSPTSIPPFAV